MVLCSVKINDFTISEIVNFSCYLHHSDCTKNTPLINMVMAATKPENLNYVGLGRLYTQWIWVSADCPRWMKPAFELASNSTSRLAKVPTVENIGSEASKAAQDCEIFHQTGWGSKTWGSCRPINHKHKIPNKCDIFCLKYEHCGKEDAATLWNSI